MNDTQPGYHDEAKHVFLTVSQQDTRLGRSVLTEFVKNTEITFLSLFCIEHQSDVSSSNLAASH